MLSRVNCERDLWPRVICMRKIVSGLFRFRLAFFISCGVWFGGISRSSLSLSLYLALSLGKFVVSFMGDASECLARRRRQRLRRQPRQRRLLLRYAIEDRRARLVSSWRVERARASRVQRHNGTFNLEQTTRPQGSNKNQHTPTCVESMP